VLVAVAFAPHPPLIVPEVASGAATELDGLRAACAEAVRLLLAARPDRVVVIGAGPPPAARWGSADAGSFAGYGVPRTVPLGPGAADNPADNPAAGPADNPAGGSRRMPLSATVGAWLLQRAGYAGRRCAVTVPAEAADPELAGWARTILDGTGVDGTGADHGIGAGGVGRGGTGAGELGGGRVGLLVMGDGSARRSPAAPGYLDARAAGFDARVAGAFRDADPAVLRSLEPALGAELLAAGVPAWRLAGWVAAAAGPFQGELLHDDAPYGVGYLVAAWVA
jgi:hypothetical protein